MRIRQASIPKWIIAVGIIFLLGFGFVQWFKWKVWDNTNLGHKPPDQVFARIFRMPVPSGVTDLRIEGISSLSGTFFMRAKVKDTNAFLRAFKNSKSLSLETSTRESDPYMAQPEKVHIIPYALSVGWEEVEKLKNAEYYAFSTAGWLGTLVIDRKNNVIYMNGNEL